MVLYEISFDSSYTSNFSVKIHTTLMFTYNLILCILFSYSEKFISIYITLFVNVLLFLNSFKCIPNECITDIS